MNYIKFCKTHLLLPPKCILPFFRRVSLCKQGTSTRHTRPDTKRRWSVNTLFITSHRIDVKTRFFTRNKHGIVFLKSVVNKFSKTLEANSELQSPRRVAWNKHHAEDATSEATSEPHSHMALVHAHTFLNLGGKYPSNNYACNVWRYSKQFSRPGSVNL